MTDVIDLISESWIRIVGQILYGLFAAIVGAIVLYIVNRREKKNTAKMAVKKEIERNKHKLEELQGRVRPIDEWNGKTSVIFSTSAYDILTVETPSLFIQLNDDAGCLPEIYDDLRYYNIVTEATFAGGQSLTGSDADNYADRVDSTISRMEDALEQI